MKLIWYEDARLKEGWSAHLEGEPELTLFAAERAKSKRWTLKGAFVPDSHEQALTCREYESLEAAKVWADRYLVRWMHRWGKESVKP